MSGTAVYDNNKHLIEGRICSKATPQKSTMHLPPFRPGFPT